MDDDNFLDDLVALALKKRRVGIVEIQKEGVLRDPKNFYRWFTEELPDVAKDPVQQRIADKIAITREANHGVDRYFVNYGNSNIDNRIRVEEIVVGEENIENTNGHEWEGRWTRIREDGYFVARLTSLKYNISHDYAGYNLFLESRRAKDILDGRIRLMMERTGNPK